MEIIWTRNKTIGSIVILVLVVAGLLAKWVFFPSVDDKFFQLDYGRLQTAPAGLLVFRPTHYADSRRSGCFSSWIRSGTGPGVPRFLGRNCTVEQIIPTAYQAAPSRVVFPEKPLTNRFDVLVTVRDKPAEKLQAALARKTGCTAHWKERETEVLELRVVGIKPAGLKPSEGQNGKSEFRSGKMHLTHAQVGQMVWMLESLLKKPVQDKTGLTGFYDYSFPWDWRGIEPPDLDKVKGWLAELGLSLRPETDIMSMLVVEQK
jgi:uncharacterized protein (TIGR03435 family)